MGPMSVGISGSNKLFRFYKSGTMSPLSGCPTYIDHAVMVVGYGVDIVTKTTPGTTTTSCRAATSIEVGKSLCLDKSAFIANRKNGSRQCCLTKTTPTVTTITEFPYWRILNTWGNGWGN